MKVIKTNVYTFDELDEKAKERARDWYREIDDLPFLEEDMSQKLGELLKKSKIKEIRDVNVQYSLAYCQGDGAMFTGVFGWGDYIATIKHRGHYYHSNSKEIELSHDETGEDANSIDYETFEKIYQNICQELEKTGYKYIEYARSNEAVDESILSNEYTFTKEGKRFG